MTGPDDRVLARRIQRMAADPRLTGRFLAAGVAMATILDSGLRPELALDHIQDLALGPRPAPSEPITAPGWSEQELDAWRDERRLDPIRALLRKDIRRYEPPSPQGICQAPMVRKGRCSRRANRSSLLTDWATGERRWCEACTRHADWFTQHIAEHALGRPEIGTTPLPCANTGGRLAPHFPEVDWVALWRDLDPRWKPMPEREPAPATPPTLRIVTTDPSPSRASDHRGTRHRGGRRRATLVVVPDSVR